MADDEYESYVRQLFGEEHYPVELVKLPEEKTSTADFEVMFQGKRVAILEVKGLQEAPRALESGWHLRDLPNGLREATREDNGPARIISKIHAAAKQLRQYAEPKILAFVNDELLLDVLDLEEAYRGFLDYDSEGIPGYRNTRFQALSDKRIGNDKLTIDLYVWVDRMKGIILSSRARANPRPFFRFGSEAGQWIARQFFGSPQREPG